MGVQHGFLKCFYGYRNLGDEFLFWGVLHYIDQVYPQVTQLTVQVGDVGWMEDRWTRNSLQMQHLHIASGFVTQDKMIKFIESDYNLRDNFRYDIYFFGGGEVFAESRGFHGGRNYLLRYPFVFLKKPFVLLGGIETPSHSLQKRLYTLLLPRAQSLVCREKTSYQTALSYNDRSRLFHDFVVPVVDAFRSHILGHHTQSLTSHDPYAFRSIDTLTGQKYILVNLIASRNDEDAYDKIHRFVELYPEHTIVYVGCGSDDRGRSDDKYGRWLQSAYPQCILYDWKQYTVIQTLYLFWHAQAGIGCRLHFLLLLQNLETDRYALVYAEKITKLISSTLDL